MCPSLQSQSRKDFLWLYLKVWLLPSSAKWSKKHQAEPAIHLPRGQETLAVLTTLPCRCSGLLIDQTSFLYLPAVTEGLSAGREVVGQRGLGLPCAELHLWHQGFPRPRGCCWSIPGLWCNRGKRPHLQALLWWPGASQGSQPQLAPSAVSSRAAGGKLLSLSPALGVRRCWGGGCCEHLEPGRCLQGVKLFPTACGSSNIFCFILYGASKTPALQNGAQPCF